MQRLNQNHIPLVCPQCKSTLQHSEKTLTCHDCGKDWQVKDDVPQFSEEDIYWGEVSKEFMQNIVKEAKNSNWLNAINTLLKPVNPRIYDYVTDSTRADWRFPITLDKSKTALDLGAGWGLLTSELAKICGTVVALEKIPLRVDFMQTRFSQDNLKNVQIIQGDFLNIPFPENSFDCIVCNGVLEWVGLYDLGRKPREAQMFFLKNLARLLKPGGTLYVGIENRFGYKQILGTRDHSGIRFTSLIPRFLANLVMRFSTKNKAFFLDNNIVPGYRTYTYTARGYHKLLRECGFQTPDIYFVIPSYSHPRWLIPADDKDAFRFLFDRLFHPRTRTGRMLKKFVNMKLPGLPQRFFMGDFCIYARK